MYCQKMRRYSIYCTDYFLHGLARFSIPDSCASVGHPLEPTLAVLGTFCWAFGICVYRVWLSKWRQGELFIPFRGSLGFEGQWRHICALQTWKTEASESAGKCKDFLTHQRWRPGSHRGTLRADGAPFSCLWIWSSMWRFDSNFINKNNFMQMRDM